MAFTDITLIARAQAKPGKESEVRAILERLIEPTLAEEGCLGYALHQGADDPTVFYFYEAFKDAAAIELHASSPYLAAAREEYKDLLASPMQITRLHQIAGNRPTN